jgi:hypothetical protein
MKIYTLSCDYARKVREKNEEILKQNNVQGNIQILMSNINSDQSISLRGTTFATGPFAEESVVLSCAVGQSRSALAGNRVHARPRSGSAQVEGGRSSHQYHASTEIGTIITSQMQRHVNCRFGKCRSNSTSTAALMTKNTKCSCPEFGVC